ncbi:hypothetical protein HID58_059977, partial [Brassica napus]
KILMVVNGLKLEIFVNAEMRYGTCVLLFSSMILINLKKIQELLRSIYAIRPHKYNSEGFLLQKMRILLERVNKFHCQYRCLIGSGGGSVGYMTNGTSTYYNYVVVVCKNANCFLINLNSLMFESEGRS